MNALRKPQSATLRPEIKRIPGVPLTRFEPTREPSTWAKMWAALSRAGWGDWAMLAMFALAFVAMVLAMAVWA